jgi:malate synthase
MRATVQVDRIAVDRVLYDFVSTEVLPGLDRDERGFWAGFSRLIGNLSPRNAELLDKRDRLQSLIDAWHREHPGARFDASSYKAFLITIGYLVPEQAAFTIGTTNVDREIAHIAGPQLVVPINNARYALNAANARWGSLYDALYGTDAIPEDGGASRRGAYNPKRGARVIDYARQFLDDTFPLATGSHRDAVGYQVSGRGLDVELKSGGTTVLADPSAFVGFQGEASAPAVILLKHHGLHVELHVDRQHYIGRADSAGISDVVLESAITTIQDCEDSVAAVTADDKVRVYRNWLVS